MISSLESKFNLSAMWPWISIEGLEVDDLDATKICGLADFKRSYRKGDIITHVGEHVAGIYFISNGEVSSTLIGENGLEKVVFIYRSPCFFNESPFITALETCMEIRALTDCVISFIDKKKIDDLISNNKSFNELLLKYMARKVYVIIDQLTDVVSLTPVKIIYKILYYYAKEHGIYADDQVTIKVSQERVAKISGLHRVTVARAFKKLKDTGIIKKTNKSTVVLSLDPVIVL